MASGWNKPLNHRWDMDLVGLRSELINFSPSGKTGKLKRSWKLHKTLGISKNPKGDGVTIRNELVYSRQRDRGGIIRAQKAEYLHFQVNGQWVKVKSVTQRRTDFVRKAVDKWVGNPRSIKARWGKVGTRS